LMITQREASTTNKLHREEMEKVLQVQRDKLNTEFERKTSKSKYTHKKELDSLKLMHSQETKNEDKSCIGDRKLEDRTHRKLASS
jgi:hypothetical protein